MGKKYWFVLQELELPKYARHGSVARPGLAVTREDTYSVFDKMLDEIRLEAETLTGTKPELVNFSSTEPNYGFEIARLKWCVFDESTAIALALMVSGKVVEHDWDAILPDDASDEDRLTKYFEEVVTKSWTDGQVL